MFNLMRRSILILAIFFAITLYSTVYGQQMKGKFALSGTGGLGFPVGDLADKEKGRAQTGYGMGGSLEYFITDNLSLGANLRYQRFGMYADDLEKDFIQYVHDSIPEADTSGIVVDGYRSTVHLGICGKYYFFVGTGLLPYIKLGAGWGKLKGFADMPGYVVYPAFRVSIQRTADASYQGEFYLDVGGGVLYLVSDRVGVSGELLFTHLSTDGTEQKVRTETKADGDYQVEQEKKRLDYNSSYINLFLTLTFFF